jgi:hypothetical protein
LKASPGSWKNIRRLYEIRRRFDSEGSDEKLQLLQLLNDSVVRSSRALMRLHSALCFIRAFPDTAAHYRAAGALLSQFEKQVRSLPAAARSEMADSGIAGTRLHYAFSYEVATWMARRSRNSTSIDWSGVEDSGRLDELLELILLPAEGDYFDSGYVSSREWVELASANTGINDFDWLLAQLRRAGPKSVLRQLYDAVDLPLTWNLQGTVLSKSLNMLPVATVAERRQGMRNRVSGVKAEIARPINSLRKQTPKMGAKLIDVAMASLAVRHRETYHFNFADSREVYVADVGEGISIVAFGLRPGHRFPLECTMGYLILSNGVPIGYGGSSAVFRQVNTGLNIFDEYRGSEAAFLWVQVMRMYHQLVGCTRFIANPYQVGHDNTEALRSGAFWFYYRLGYRPVSREIRTLAAREWKKTRRDKSYRSSIRTLRHLSSCDMHLVLPGARASDLFEERWLETSSLLATRQIASEGGRTRADSLRRVAARVSRDLGMRSLAGWSANQRRGLEHIAPFVAAAHPAEWPSDAKRSMRKLLRAKGGPREARFARLLSEHEHFLAELRASCRREDF